MPTQPPTLSGTGMSTGRFAAWRLGSKGWMDGSCYMCINVWVAGKSEWSLTVPHLSALLVSIARTHYVWVITWSTV